MPSTNILIQLSKHTGKYTYEPEVKEDADEEEEGAEEAPRTVYEGEWLNGQKVSVGTQMNTHDKN